MRCSGLLSWLSSANGSGTMNSKNTSDGPHQASSGRPPIRAHTAAAQGTSDQPSRNVK